MLKPRGLYVLVVSEGSAPSITPVTELGDTGFDVGSTTLGPEALLTIRITRPHVVLVEVEALHRSSGEFIRAVVEQAAWRRPFIVLVRGAAVAETTGGVPGVDLELSGPVDPRR